MKTDNIKSIASIALAFSIFSLSVAVIYFAWEAYQWRKELPEMLRLTNETIEKAVAEVRVTREAIPGIMVQADQIVKGVKDAGKEAGKEAGKSAVTGFVGGVVSMPISLVGGALNFLSPQDKMLLTEEDIGLMEQKTTEIVENGSVGQTLTWENKNTSISGNVTLVEKHEEDGRPCRKIKLVVFSKGKTKLAEMSSGCRQPDGRWTVKEEALPEE